MVEQRGAYAEAGVDIEAANRTKQAIKEAVRSTFSPAVLGDLGGFGGLFVPPFGEYREPVLVGSVDGVGTKLKLAFLSGIHDTVGIDIVSHCGNDILVQGARPLFFMDYLAMGRHDPEVAEAVVRGVAQGCRQIGCALIGGETAEMPGFYAPGEYDLAGSIVGIVDRERIVDGRGIGPGDVILGLASDGLHTNGYSLARRVVFEQAGLGLDDRLGDTGRTVVEELLRPHRPYVTPVLSLLAEVPVKGMAHLTGGGFWDNLPRTLAKGLRVRVRRGSWEVPAVFSFLQHAGKISEREMFHVFNMGVGLVLFVAAADADRAVAILRSAGEDARVIGEVDRGEEPVVLEG
ncbi:MAG: phosphoribosylformylglycinamidine cyclo-ligase [Candidatus Latescibacterota bacterium]|jgi:phosphoribosylformylglycinamidine cyclo-ligase